MKAAYFDKWTGRSYPRPNSVPLERGWESHIFVKVEGDYVFNEHIPWRTREGAIADVAHYFDIAQAAPKYWRVIERGDGGIEVIGHLFDPQGRHVTKGATVQYVGREG